MRGFHLTEGPKQNVLSIEKKQSTLGTYRNGRSDTLNTHTDASIPVRSGDIQATYLVITVRGIPHLRNSSFESSKRRARAN